MKKTKKNKAETNIQAILINADNTVAALGLNIYGSKNFEKRLSESQLFGRKKRRIHRVEDTFIYE